ncbi:MAG: DUF1648 domain-containing protein [Bacteroidota bacterium]
MKKYRPKLELERSETERLFDALTIGGLVLLVALPLLHYGSLPETVPSHFGPDGQADGWSKKIVVWIIPAIGILLAVLMFYLTKIPHLYNYMQEITPENAAQQYQRGRTLIRFFNVFDTFIFVGITWIIIKAAKDEIGAWQAWIAPIIIALTVIAVGYAMYMSYRKD